MSSISREPRCEEYTICTAVAPDAVFAVSTTAPGNSTTPGLRSTQNPALANRERAAHNVASVQNPES